MKIIISKTLIIIMIINLFLTCTTYAESTDMQVYFDNESITYGSDVEKFDDDYYVAKDRINKIFNYREESGEIFISRYGTELKITFGSDGISINGKVDMFSKPVQRIKEVNYISLRLITSVFGSNININEIDRTINVTLNEKPVSPINRSLNGVISLPNDEVAPPSGIAFKITATRSDVYGSNNIKYVVIDSGKNNADYQLNIENDTDTYAEYSIKYEIIDGYKFDKYVSVGYFSYIGTRSNTNKQSLVFLTENTNINLNVVGKKIITGTVNRNGYNSYIHFYVPESDYIQYYNYGSDFNMLIPCDLEKIHLNYYAFDYDAPEYLHYGYYGKKGTLPFPDEENYIDVSSITSNIQVDILKGKLLTGTVNFPETMKDRQIDFTINSEINNNTTSNFYYTKPSAITHMDYSVTVPIFDSNKYILHYFQNGLNGYVDSEGKVSQDRSIAKEIDITNGDSFTQDIIVEQPKVYGTISLPNNELAPVGGTIVNVSLNINPVHVDGGTRPTPTPSTTPAPTSTPTPVSDQSISSLSYGYNSSTTIATIPEGKNSIEYELPIVYEMSSYYQLYLECSTLDGRYSYEQSIYCNNNTTSKLIDITLNKMTQVSGVVTLPQNEIATEDLCVTVSAGNYTTNTTIVQGRNSAKYYLMVQSNKSYNIGYEITNAEEYLRGYYSKKGTVTYSWNADNLDTSNDIFNINMQVLKATCISGIISLPQDMTAFNEDTVINLGSNIGSTTIVLPQGAVSVPYKMYLQTENLNQVYYFNYYLSSSLQSKLWRVGYYTNGGISSRTAYFNGLFSGTKAENVNIALIKSIELTGNVKLPDDKLAQNDIMWNITAIPLKITSDNSFDISIVNKDLLKASLEETSSGSSSGGSSSTTVVVSTPLITHGSNSSPYKIIIPEDYNTSRYKLMYTLYDCKEYYKSGYYTASGTTSQIDNADIIRNQNNLDITLINKTTVTGTITKPISVSDDIYLDMNVLPTSYLNNYENTKRYTISGKDSTFDYSLDIPSDVPNFNVRYYIYKSPGSSIFKNLGCYNSSKENSITTNEYESQPLNVIDNPIINFTLPLSSTDNYPLAIDDIYDVNNNIFNIRNDTYNTKNFTIKVVNKTLQDALGTIFVTRYDKNGKLIEVVSQKATLPQKAMSNIILKFGSNRIYETDKIKAIVWDTEQRPLANSFVLSNLLP